MSDEDIIKKRLLIDGDGTGDDRRLNMLLKQFLKWMYSKNDSTENNQIIYDRLMAQLAQCQFAAAKTERTSLMINEELENYQKLSQTIEKNIYSAKQEIEESKKELITAKQIRKNKMEYDQLAKVIKQQPDRKETQKQIEILQKELTELTEKKLKLERKFEKRQKDFTVLMYAIRELETQLADDSSSEDEDTKSDDAEIMVGSSVSVANAVVNAVIEGLSDDEMEAGSQSGKGRHRRFLEREVKDIDIDLKDDYDNNKSPKESLSVDEDAILELSIEKDEQDGCPFYTYEILMAATKTLRTLLQELRLASPCACIKDSLVARYILAQYKKFSTTDQQLCKARDEALFLGQTYLTYLSSVRKYNELHKEYRGKGERSIKETCDMVGFKLPTDPK
uniref:Protein FMC1 homolog n=1 Tax=Glossina brevipalpis TaxID=37001 RepID=A0A1A9WPC0_9MUSC